MRRVEKTHGDRKKKRIISLVSIVVAIISVVVITMIFVIIGKFNHKSPEVSTVIKAQKLKEKSSSSKSNEENYEGLIGYFYSDSGEQANVWEINKNNWEISYTTTDGEFTATFETKWENKGGIFETNTPMNKSDGYSNFDIYIKYVSVSDVTITMSDGNPSHKMIFTKNKIKPDQNYKNILKGDLSSFSGQLSNEELNSTIANSGFIYGGYSPEDYFDNKTTVFPEINDQGYWDGFTSHGDFKIENFDLPKKVDDYYKVHLYGNNAIVKGSKLTLYLVPQYVMAPDGTVSKERRVYKEISDGKLLLFQYQKDDWWKKYKSEISEKDLDIESINNGNLSSLAGIWKNGQGDILIINSDGSTNKGGRRIMSVKDSEKSSKIPYAGLGDGIHSGEALGLLKIGFKNPDGDYSDSSRARLVISQQSGDYPASQYYYRQ